MRIGYLIDLNKGGYDQPMPTPEDAHDTVEMMIQEGIIAEQAGFHSLQVPHRHGRTECYFPGPSRSSPSSRARPSKVAIGTFTYVGTLYHPMKAAEQFAIIDNLSEGRLYTTVSRGFHPGYWMQFGIPQEKLLGRFNEAIKIWQRGLQGRALRLRRRALAGGAGAAGARSPTRRAGGRSGAAATRARAAIRRSAAYGEAGPATRPRCCKDVWDERAPPTGEYAEELGKKPFIVLMRDGWVDDSFERAAGEFGTHLRQGDAASTSVRASTRTIRTSRSESDITIERLRHT